MITFGCGTLIQMPEELPSIPSRIDRLYADFETSSGDPTKDSKNPWFDCTAIGASIAFGDGPVWFVPRGLLLHNNWFADVLARTVLWINHNIKYDMHVCANDLGIIPKCKVLCTLNSAKLINSDRGFSGGYGLDALSKDWLGEDIGQYEWAMRPYILPRQNKDYGRIPLDLLAEYANVDVRTNRELHKYILDKLPAESQDVFETEQALTYHLFNMERTGVRVDPTDLQIKQVQVLYRMLVLEAELERIVGRSFRPHVNDDVYDVLCNQYGLPVLAYTTPDDDDELEAGAKVGGPSFNKHALAMYAVHPFAPPGLVPAIQEYRKLNTFNNLFLNKWDKLNINGVMHCTFNQTVRTGRMSGSKPNLQQLNEVAKELIIPPPGYGIVSADLSQIEFRVIVHYLENKRCIEAYQNNPWTDFHNWVAETAGIPRKPAKTVNFLAGYGGGKKRMQAALSTNKDLVGNIIAAIEANPDILESHRAQAILDACKRKADQVYNDYHRLLPELKPTAKLAGSVCYRKGYVRNHYGRHCHKTQEASWAAFNTVCQGTAADLFKERTVAVAEEVPEFEQTAVVHDQIVGLLPLEILERDEPENGGNHDTMRKIVHIMNSPRRPLRVPVRTGIGWSPKNWAHAQSEKREHKFF